MSMTPGTRLDVEVEVRIDGQWYFGTLEHRRHVDDRWQGFVRWSVGVGQTHSGWLDREDIRPAE